MSEKPANDDRGMAQDNAEKTPQLSEEERASDVVTPPLAVAPLPVYSRPSRQTSYDYVDRSAGGDDKRHGLRLALFVLASIAIVLGFVYGAWVVSTPVWKKGDAGSATAPSAA